MKIVGIFGNYGVGNLGDEVVLSILLFLFQERGFQVIVFSGRPEKVSSEYSVSSFLFFPCGVRSFLSLFCFAGRKRFRESMRALKSCDQVVFGGGGLFVDDVFGAVVLWWVQLLFCVLLKKKTVLLSQNFSVTRWYARLLWVPLFRRVFSITVRDSPSQKCLSDLGIQCECLPDISFLRPPVLRSSGLGHRILVSLRDYSLRPSQKVVIADFLKSLSREYALQFLVFQREVHDDRALYEELAVPGEILEGDDVFSAYPNAFCLIGMRYHSLVFALQARLPFLALPYQPKVANFVRDIGMSSFSVPLAGTDLHSFTEKFRLLQLKRELVQDQLDRFSRNMERMTSGYLSLPLFRL